MRLIELTRGFFTKVDDDDYAYLSQFSWCVFIGKYKKYAYRGTWDSLTKKTSSVYLHKEIINCSKDECIVHIDGDGLNNQKKNLLKTGFSGKAGCRAGNKNTSSKHKGVYYYKKNKKWRACICKKHLGTFESEEEALIAYNKAAKKYYKITYE